jgi:hypothetical protein
MVMVWGGHSLSAAVDLDSGFLPALVGPKQNGPPKRPVLNTERLRLRSRRNCRFWRRTRNTLNFFLRVAFRAGGSRLANVDAALEERAVLD